MLEGEILIHAPVIQQQCGEFESPCSRADVPVSLLLAVSGVRWMEDFKMY
jgi:hypothetical protein